MNPTGFERNQSPLLHLLLLPDLLRITAADRALEVQVQAAARAVNVPARVVHVVEVGVDDGLDFGHEKKIDEVTKHREGQ